MAPAYNYEYFNVSSPIEYVAHVEIGRADKMNAFKEVYVVLPSGVHLPRVKANIFLDVQHVVKSTPNI